MTSAVPAVPPEIYAIICEELEETATLVILCRTSRLFRDQAQRILYRSVDLIGCGIRTVQSWTLSVIRNTHLAERVHSLSLKLPETLEPSDATKITLALNKCVNLKKLEMACAGLRPRSNSKCTWMIEDCPFRLRAFRNSYFDTSEGWMTKFWQAQTEIRVLSFPREHSPVPTQYMPKLVALQSNLLSDLPPDRPLQRIHTRWERDLSPLARYAQSLTTLNLETHWIDALVPLFDILRTVADSLPSLWHLWLVERKKESWSPFPVEHAPTTVIQRLSKLRTFVFHVRNVFLFVDESNIDIDYFRMHEPADLAALGTAIMAACPTLYQINLGGEVRDDEELTCVLTRSSEGEIHAEHGNEFDSDAASMFW